MERLNKLWNLPVKNPTQTAYTRFLNAPWGEIKTPFTQSLKAWESAGKDAWKTSYDSLWKKEATYD
jgi:hypothetical protein